MFHLSIDSSDVSHLPCCTCGWRGLPSRKKETAWEQARAHEERAHTGQIQALNAFLAYRKTRRARIFD